MTTTTKARLNTANLKAGDFIAWHNGGELAYVIESAPGRSGQGFRLAQHDGVEAGYYVPDLPAVIVKRGDTVTTPQGPGTVVGFERSIRRLLVQVRATPGAHAVKFADCHLGSQS